MYNIMHLPAVIELGVVGDNQFRSLEFDLRPWLEVKPDGVGSIVHIRPGETGDDAYVAATTMENGILTWELTAGDVGDVEGYGQMEVWLEDMTGVRGKSAKCQTYVRSSLALTHEIPEAQEAWLEQMTGLKTQTVIASQAASQAASDAAATLVQTQALADRMYRLADDVEERANNAIEIADNAAEVAAQASTTATGAQNAATQARSTADQAQQDAAAAISGIRTAAEEATDAAEDASNNAQTATTKAGEAAASATSAANSAADATAAKNAAVAAAATASAAYNTDIVGDNYDASKTYAVGDYVIYSGSLYRCTTEITEAEAWTAAHWTAVALGNDVSDLKSALGTGFINTTDSSGDANNFSPGVTRVTATASHIPVAQVGYVVTFARTETTAKAQIFINAPTGTYTGRCHLYARYLVSGTWSSWIDFADNADLSAPWTNGADYSGNLNDAPGGVTRVLTTATNNPSSELGYLMTIVRAASAKAQIFFSINNLYFRNCASSVWSDWKSIGNGSSGSETDRHIGYTFGDSLMAQDGRNFAYANPQYNTDEIGQMCVGWQTLLHNEFGVTMTNYAVGGQGIAGQKPVIKSKTYNDVDFVIISVGVNDYSNAVQLGQLPTSRNATFTNGLFIDDLCESIEYILSENPDIKILLFTPCQRDTTWRNSGVPDFSKSATDIYTQNSKGLYLKDYADAIKDIGRMYSCVVCDMYAESGLNYLTLPEFTFEGVHPTNEGYAFTSRVLFEAFKKL